MSTLSTKANRVLAVIHPRPGDDVGRLIGAFAAAVKSGTSGNSRTSGVAFEYGGDGHLLSLQIYAEGVPDDAVLASPTPAPATSRSATAPMQTSRKRRKRTNRATQASSTSTGTDPSPRQRDRGRVRMGRNGDLAKFIATLPTPNPRTDLKGTRWSNVAIREWLPDAMSSGSRQTRSKALNPLIRAGVLNVSELRNMRVSELLALPGMGEGGVTYLAHVLALHGLRFKPEPRQPAKD